jgi:CheY-like chemotaxis protein
MAIGREVLIVEDDAATRALLSALTHHYGFTPTLAENGASALAQLARRPFDVIVMDLLLPGTNGFEVLRHLKCTNPAMLRRTIIMTAAVEATTQDCTELQQVWKFLRKPLDIEDLATQMLACTDEHAQKSRTSDLEVRSLVPGNDATAH